MFGKTLINDNKYEWFKDKLSDDFKITDNSKPKVIFGFNGVGKTTIYNIMKQNENEGFDYLNYDELKSYIGKGKELIIEANINEIEELKDKIADKQKEISIDKVVRDKLGLTKKAEREPFGERFENDVSNKCFSGFHNEKTKIEEVANKLSDLKPSIYIKVRDSLKEINDIKSEIETSEKELIFLALNHLKEIKYKDGICPVCDNKVENLNEVILKKLDKLKGKESEAIKILRDNKVDNISEDKLRNIIESHVLFEDDNELLVDYLFCNGDVEIYDEINSLFTEVTTYEEKVKQLESEAKEIFQNVLNKKYELIRDLIKYYDLEEEDITFRDFKIIINFKRNINTFSTGEINLIMFLYKIYSFIGSNNKYLIMDDPMSSLDLINQYKIAYEIVRNTGEDKTLIILTHNVDLVNIINSQHPYKFEYYYIEEIENILHLLRIPKIRDNNPNIIDINKLESEEKYKSLISILKERDDVESPNQNVFHWTDEKEFVDDNSFSNRDLTKLIDDFEEFELKSFYVNSFLKILYISALRIWVERELCKLIQDDSVKEKYFKKQSLSNKITYLLPTGGVNKIIPPKEDLRSLLLSKKVMLNQNIHYQSQISPFHYAINISLDDLSKEIKEIKSLFKQ